MSTSMQCEEQVPQPKSASQSNIILRRYEVIQTQVNGFATQAIESIMAQSSEDTVYCDVVSTITVANPPIEIRNVGLIC